MAYNLDEIREIMNSYANENHISFFKKISKEAENVQGIKVPDIKRIAKLILKQDSIHFINKYKIITHEDLFLLGQVIAGLKIPLNEKINYIKEYVVKIYDWSSCDIFVSALKFQEQKLPIIYDFIIEYKDSKNEYEVRFMLVMLLTFFINDKYLNNITSILNSTPFTYYYTQMAAAWLISTMYVKYKDYTIEFLKNNKLDDFTHNKACQKIRESTKVKKEEKEYIKTLKR